MLDALSLVPKRPESSSDHGRVYRWLKAVTVDYRFRPGEQLMIGELAEHLRVSSTPVRETLIRLQAEALLDSAPRRGFFAKTLNLKEMADLLQFRFWILRSSIEQATDLLICATAEITQSLVVEEYRQRNCANGSDIMDPPDQLRDNALCVERVSENIAALSDNKDIMRAIVNANERTRYVHMIDLEEAERLSDLRLSMTRLSEALQKNDAARAINTLERHLDDQIVRMPALVKEGISRAYSSPPWTSVPLQLSVPAAALARKAVASRMTSTRS